MAVSIYWSTNAGNCWKILWATLSVIKTHTSHRTPTQAELIPCFCSMKQLLFGVYSPPDELLVHRLVIPNSIWPIPIMNNTLFSLADRWNYSALYDKSMKLVTLILGIVGNVLKIRGNLDRSCGSWEGRGISNMAAIQTIKTVIGKMKQNELDTVLNCHFSYVCMFNFPSKQNINIFRADLTEFWRSFYFQSNYANWIIHI